MVLIKNPSHSYTYDGYEDVMVETEDFKNIYVYENFSFNTYQSFSTSKHHIHEKIRRAKETQSEYDKLDMNEAKSANYLTKRFMIKPLCERNERATIFMNEVIE